MPWWTRSAAALHERVLRHGLAIEEIAQSYLARIAEREAQVRAWAWCDPAQVRAAARALDRAAAQGPLCGVAIGLKDIIDTVDMPTAYGAVLYEGHRPVRDAEVVRRLRAAGALLVGKTVTTEFAYSFAGPTTNPHNVLHTPGGSSSGSAAAVAAGMVSLALGSQTGGSIIRPAAFCGIVGFKPTFGLIPYAGVKALAPSSDTVGIHARSITDIELVLPVLLGSAVNSNRAAVGATPRIAYFPGPHAADASVDARAALCRARQALREDGCVVEPIDLPAQESAALSDANRLIMAFEAARSLSREYDAHRDALSAPSARLIETGRATPVERYRAALALAAGYRETLSRAMAGFDALMTLSAPGEAPLARDGLGTSLFNRAWSTLGTPCLNLPCGRGGSFGLPLGVQFVALPGDDARLLALGRRIERCFAPHNHVPDATGGA